MRVKMLEDAPVTVDGVNTVDAIAGDELEVGDGIAHSLIDSGRAAPVDADDETPTPRRRGKKAAVENKADGGAAENKQDAES